MIVKQGIDAALAGDAEFAFYPVNVHSSRMELHTRDSQCLRDRTAEGRRILLAIRCTCNAALRRLSAHHRVSAILIWTDFPIQKNSVKVCKIDQISVEEAILLAVTGIVPTWAHLFRVYAISTRF